MTVDPVQFLEVQLTVAASEQAAANSIAASVSSKFGNMFNHKLVGENDQDTDPATGWMAKLHVHRYEADRLRDALLAGGLTTLKAYSVDSRWIVTNKRWETERKEYLAGDSGWRVVGAPFVTKPPRPNLSGARDAKSTDALAFLDSRWSVYDSQAPNYATVAHQSVVWAGASRCTGCWWAYEATGDMKWLTTGLKYCDAFLANRDDKDGMVNGGLDQARANSLIPGWTNDYYTEPGWWTSWFVQAGHVNKAILEICWAILRDSYDISLRDQAWSHVFEAEKSVMAHMETNGHDQYHLLGGNDGAWYWDATNIVYHNNLYTALNQMLTMVHSHLLLYKITNSDFHKDRAVQLGLMTRNEFRRDDGRPGLYWHYRTRFNVPTGRIEDFGHARVISEFVTEMHRAGLVFDAQDVADIQLRVRANYDGRTTGFYNYLDQRNFHPQNSGYTTDWGMSNVCGNQALQGAKFDPPYRDVYYEWGAEERNWDFDDTSSEVKMSANTAASDAAVPFLYESRE